MNIRKIIGIVVAVAVVFAAGAAIRNHKKKKMSSTDTQLTMQPGDALVEIKTSEGDIEVRLFGDTPAHRDNFLKLVKEGYYNGVLFHRVINGFMVQTGDPDSKNAPAGKQLGAGGPDYTLEAEIRYPAYFHKRGALAAARQGDQVNPERRSSGSQFYIVTGKTYNDSTLAMVDKQLQISQMQGIFNDLTRQHRDTIMEMRRNRDTAGLQALQQELVAQTEAKAKENPASLTDAQRQAYKTVGGAPHLDNQYTVFGEVVKGQEVVDKIEKAETDGRDRPTSDIRIISAKVLREPK